MNDAPRDSGPLPDEAATRDGESEADLVALRRLLVGREQQELEALKARLDDPALHARDVGDVLAEAVALRAKASDDLSRALEPIVVDALRLAVRKEPALVVDVVYPVIGPAIRRAVAASFKEMTASINRALADAFSIRGLRWRWQAWRTGRPFAEIVMQHSLVYRVEEVFLIHRETGLVLSHAARPGVEALGEEAVAAMLVAIQDFAVDAFRADQRDALDALQVGDLSLWVESGPTSVLAVALRGVAPEELRETMQESLEAIHREVGDLLESFSGDVSPFEATVPYLVRCLTAMPPEAANLVAGAPVT